MFRLDGVALVTMGLMGCSGGGSASRVEVVDVPSASATERSAESAAPAPVVAIASAPAPVASEVPSSGGHACLMLYECGCNAGCTEIDAPRSALHDGLQVNITSGSLAGTKAFVAKNRNDLGSEVFTVQRADPKAGVQVCGGSGARSLVGYLCATTDSGKARACQKCGS